MVRSAHKLQFDPPYDQVFNGILSFRRFSDAENTIQRLEDLRRGYRAVGDAKGLEYCRQVALTGRKRAGLISHNHRIAVAKRIHKREIALWFQIWLESPEIFESWLALRKKTKEYEGMVNSEKSDADIENWQSRSGECL